MVAVEEKETGAVSGMVDALCGRLLEELPGFGRHLGYDGKATASRRHGVSLRGAALVTLQRSFCPMATPFPKPGPRFPAASGWKSGIPRTEAPKTPKNPRSRG